MHTFLSCRTADGASHYSPPGIRSPLTEVVPSRILIYAVSLSLSHTHTHTHCSSGTPPSLSLSLARDIYEGGIVVGLQRIRPKKTYHR
jgi:hypothetical protein